MSTATLDRRNAAVGALLWSAGMAWQRTHPLNFTWPAMLILLAALVLVPLGRAVFVETFLQATPRAISWLQLPAVCCLCYALLLPSSALATALSVPWMIVCLSMAAVGISRWRDSDLAQKISLTGWLQLSIGGAWLVADRMGYGPMGFDGVIVRLTAAHFHVAGFILPLIAGLLLHRDASTWARWSAIGSATGILLVAVGITLTKMGVSPVVESVLAATFSAIVLALGLRLCWHGWLNRNGWLILSGASLTAGMILAFLYAMRLWWPIPWLSIPWMWAVHGSIQVFGFALCGLLGFRPHSR